MSKNQYARNLDRLEGEVRQLEMKTNLRNATTAGRTINFIKPSSPQNQKLIKLKDPFTVSTNGVAKSSDIISPTDHFTVNASGVVKSSNIISSVKNASSLPKTLMYVIRNSSPSKHVLSVSDKKSLVSLEKNDLASTSSEQFFDAPSCSNTSLCKPLSDSKSNSNHSTNKTNNSKKKSIAYRRETATGVKVLQDRSNTNQKQNPNVKPINSKQELNATQKPIKNQTELNVAQKQINIQASEINVSSDAEEEKKFNYISNMLANCYERTQRIPSSEKTCYRSKSIKNKRDSLSPSKSIPLFCDTIVEEISGDDDIYRSLTKVRHQIDGRESSCSLKIKPVQSSMKSTPNLKRRTSKLPKYVGATNSNTHMSSTESIVNTEQLQQLSKELANEKEIRDKTEILVQELRTAIYHNTDELRNMERNKQAACDLAHTLKQKYDKIKIEQENTMTQLKVLQRENKILSNKLDTEIEMREKMLRDRKSLTIERLKERDQLYKTLVDKKRKELESEYNEKFNASREKNEILGKERDRLTKQLTKLQEEATKAREECNRLNAELNQTKENSVTANQEKQRLQMKLTNLEAKVSKLIEHEEKLKNATCELGADVYEKIKLSVNLYQRCRQLENQLKAYQEEDMKNVEAVQADLYKFTKAMKDKEKLLLAEKEQLTKLVSDLNELVKVHKKRIEEVLDLNKRQKYIIRVQQVQLLSKDKKIKELAELSEESRKKNDELQQKVYKLKENDQIIENLKLDLNDRQNIIQTNQTVIQALQKDLETSKKNLENDKDALLLKDKIIEDQSNTIQKLKVDCKGVPKDEVRKLIKELTKTRQGLEHEKNQKDQILRQLSNISRENNQLHNQIELLEAEFRFNNGGSDNVNRKHQVEILNDLERKVEAKQKQWNIQRELLAKEKNEAVSAARFATKKLIETVIEFQNQVEAQKKVQNTLTMLLSEKDNQLKLASEQMRKEMTAVQLKEKTESITRKELEKKIKEASSACHSVIANLKMGFEFETNEAVDI